MKVVSYIDEVQFILGCCADADGEQEDISLQP